MDTLQHFIWRPYLDCLNWPDDVVHLSFCRQQRYLIGRTFETQWIIEMYLPRKVVRQFGEVQVTLVATAYFAHVSREVSDWGVCIQPHVTSAEFDSLQPLL